MAYTKLNWLNRGETGAIPINKDNLNHMDNGISNNDSAIGNLANLSTPVKDNLVNAINSTVIESGTNSNGTYIKYDNGIMICTKTVEGSVDLTEQYYDYFYHTSDGKYFNLGDYAMPFKERPICNITFRGGNAQWIGAIQNQSATHAGDLHILTVTSKTAGAYYDVIAIGRWK